MISLVEVEVIRERVSLAHIQELATELFGDLVKAVIDVDRGIMAIGGELHADEEAQLLDDGSAQASLWDINLYPAQFGETGWLEFDSMINVRPSAGNRTRRVEDTAIQRRIAEVLDRLVVE